MSTLAYALTDSATMVRRVLRHTKRNPAALIISFVLPLIMLLLFNYAFGGALNTGSVAYLNYVVPGILILGVAYSVQATALSVHADVSEGIVDRFRTMAIARSAVLIGHVIGSTLRTLAGLTVVVLVALAIGFRPTATPLEWLATVGIVTLMLVAFAWLGTAFGLAAKTPTGVGSLSLVVTLLPFLSGAFAPTNTMPGWLQVFTANQPMTHVIETLRGLLLGSRIGNHGWLAVTWCLAIALLGYVWAQAVFNRRAPR
jgi:ABC-2 type transport system permease protein